MKKIYGIGLPRTGTTSLSSFLGCTHYCCITSLERNDSQGQKIIVDNSMYSSYKNLPVDSLFILTTRDKEDWLNSINKFENISNDMPMVDKYLDEVTEYFASINKTNNLLIINVFEETDIAKKLTKFLKSHDTKTTFPHIRVDEKRDNTIYWPPADGEMC